jgi:hypothetical protein
MVGKVLLAVLWERFGAVGVDEEDFVLGGIKADVLS